MSLKWPAKGPAETLNYSVDWSRFLDGATIASVTWAITDATGTPVTIVTPPETVNGLTVIGYTNTNTVATIQLSAGTNGITYKLTCTIVFGSGLTASRTIQLPVREK